MKWINFPRIWSLFACCARWIALSSFPSLQFFLSPTHGHTLPFFHGSAKALSDALTTHSCQAWKAIRPRKRQPAAKLIPILFPSNFPFIICCSTLRTQQAAERVPSIEPDQCHRETCMSWRSPCLNQRRSWIHLVRALKCVRVVF